MQEMGEDSRLVQVTRITAVLLGVTLLVLGALLLEGSLLETLLPSWGWLLRAAVGGATMGLGAGFGVAGWTGENRSLDRIRAAQDGGKLLSPKNGVEDSIDHYVRPTSFPAVEVYLRGS